MVGIGKINFEDSTKVRIEKPPVIVFLVVRKRLRCRRSKALTGKLCSTLLVEIVACQVVRQGGSCRQQGIEKGRWL